MMRFRLKICLMVFLASLLGAGTHLHASSLGSLKLVKPDSGAKAVSAEVTGFRSANFSMDEKEIYRAIFKDFKIPRSKIARSIHPVEKTITLGITVEDLLPGSGASHIFYILGHRSEKLMQVNIIWGKPVDPKSEPQTVVETANQLRNHFIQEGFQREGLAVNTPLEDGSILVFRGKDQKGRMAVLLLQNPADKGGEKGGANKIDDVNLRLSYIEKPDAPDIFKIKKGDF
ncbi:MAG: hypothetical protein G3M78_14405 [Candidatus Nitrohelix vancouverensis]|uniref:POTRA domain-containing protein n=1 Tax=Candidatus Nitrohelix vancouverensis TaxID=2705534 RepID=A0A7T0G4P4_9BACT|nr:MAG: hypothetical protein G3M78_14405 [Candidatus Nitrohelix vancouverensis]